MPIAKSPAAKGYDSPKHDHVLRDFSGVNTQASRYAIGPNEFAWLENLIPVGPGNLRCVPTTSAVKATLTGESIYYWTSANINGVDYAYAICTSGAGYQIKLSDYTTTKFANAGSFSGSGASICQWKNERILIIDPSTGYFSWDGATFATVSGSTFGTTIASYAGRVWIGNNRTVQFTDAGSYTSFAGSGGSFIMTDETLHSSIKSLQSANGFLYIFGTTSIDVVGDVRVSSGVALYSKTNLTASVGTDIPQSIVINERAIWFANQYGFYSMRGAQPRKESSDIDTTYNYINQASPITGGLCMIFNHLYTAFLVTYNDPYTGTTRQVLACAAGDRKSERQWFFASQGTTLTRVIGVTASGVPKMLGTDGTNIYELFSDATSAISSTIRTPLWDFGDPIVDKQVLKVGIGTVLPANSVSFSVTIDTEYSGTSSPINFSGTNSITWLNNSNNAVSWLNNAAQVVIWLSTGYSLMESDATGLGKHIGLTITSTSPGYSINSIMLEFLTRARW